MKTVIYYNVTTGDSYDSAGTLRSVNNPFLAFYGERAVFEWHLVSSVSTDVPAQWPALTDYAVTPVLASVATDNNYTYAYKGTLSSKVEGETSLISIETNAPEDHVSGSGNLRLFSGEAPVLVPYSARVKTQSGYDFIVNETFECEYPIGNQADVMEQPLAKTTVLQSDSDSANGIFLFQVDFNTWRLRNIFDYGNVSELQTKGLELRVAGFETDGTEVEISRCVVPFIIRSSIDSVLSGECSPAPSLIRQYQTWTTECLNAGLDVQFSADGTDWTAVAGEAFFFRMRPSAFPNSSWTQSIPIRCEAEQAARLEYSFTIPIGYENTAFEILYSVLEISEPAPVFLFEKQTDGSELNITHNACLLIYHCSDRIKLQWAGAFPAGQYVVRS